MQTRLFTEFTSSCDFFRKVKISVIGGIVTDLCRRMEADGGVSLARDSMGHVTPEHREALLEWMGRVGRRDVSDPMARRFLGLVDAGCRRDFDAAGEAYAELLMKRGVAIVGAEGFLALASDIMMPDGYRERLTAIVSLSPGAFDCVVNLDCDNPLFPRNPFMAYAISALLAQDEGVIPAVSVHDCCEYARLIPRMLPEPPIFVIARSYFVADLVSGRLAVKEVPAETLRLIFS
jgi:hypothetical protein